MTHKAFTHIVELHLARYKVPWGPQGERSYRTAHLFGVLLLLLLFDYTMFSGVLRMVEITIQFAIITSIFFFTYLWKKKSNHFPWSFGLLFTWLHFEHLFLIFSENTFVVLAFFHMECYIWCWYGKYYIVNSRFKLEKILYRLMNGFWVSHKTPVWFLLKSKQSVFLPIRI